MVFAMTLVSCWSEKTAVLRIPNHYGPAAQQPRKGQGRTHIITPSPRKAMAENVLSAWQSSGRSETMAHLTSVANQ
jgi:hypothetical protein